MLRAETGALCLVTGGSLTVSFAMSCFVDLVVTGRFPRKHLFQRKSYEGFRPETSKKLSERQSYLLETPYGGSRLPGGGS